MCSLLRIAVKSGGVPAHARISDADKAAVFRSDGELSTDEWLGRSHGELGLARGVRRIRQVGSARVDGIPDRKGCRGQVARGSAGFAGLRPGRVLRPAAVLRSV